MESKTKTPDLNLIGLIIIFLIIGLITILSVSPVVSFADKGIGTFYIEKHIFSIIIGLILFITASFFNYHNYKKLTLYILGGAFLLLIATLIPHIGIRIGGAARWLKIGKLQLQTSEIAKIAMIFYIAQVVVNKREKLKEFINGLLPALIILGTIVIFILLQPDLSTSIIIIMTTLVMLFLGGAQGWHMALIGLIGIRASTFLILHTPYQKERILGFFKSMGRSSGKRISHHSIMACNSFRRISRSRTNPEQIQIQLSSRTTHRLFFFNCR
ncbi:FtsW/RodA/SpoVE family cell cycle protein [Candidatus Margulisiibacteriota bacterium]